MLRSCALRAVTGLLLIGMRDLASTGRCTCISSGEPQHHNITQAIGVTVVAMRARLAFLQPGLLWAPHEAQPALHAALLPEGLTGGASGGNPH